MAADADDCARRVVLAAIARGCPLPQDWTSRLADAGKEVWAMLFEDATPNIIGGGSRPRRPPSADAPQAADFAIADIRKRREAAGTPDARADAAGGESGEASR
jgi:hypothetical protein